MFVRFDFVFYKFYNSLIGDFLCDIGFFYSQFFCCYIYNLYIIEIRMYNRNFYLMYVFKNKKIDKLYCFVNNNCIFDISML